MARKTVVHITDDLDGSTGAREVHFGYEGVEYRIDLSKKNRTAVEKVLRPYIEAGDKISRRSSRRSPGRPASASRDLAAVRTWARENGMQVSDRGRVPKSVVEQFDAAQK